MTPDLRYPIGRFQPQPTCDADAIRGHVDAVASLPAELRAAIDGLDAGQLATPYREGGWTVAQVVHHLPDSHLHSYVRFRFALAEDKPTIKPYDEVAWAELPDARTTDVSLSLALLDALHAKWVAMMRGLTPIDWTREYLHPERGVDTLARTVALYAWHGRHHVAHITALRTRMGW